MTTHELAPSEWPILADTDLGSVLPLLAPCADQVRVMAVFDATGELAGCWAALRMVHVEGVWVAESHRGKAGVARALWRHMRAICAEWQASSVLTASVDPTVTSLILAHRGTALPECFVLPMEGRL